MRMAELTKGECEQRYGGSAMLYAIRCSIAAGEGLYFSLSAKESMSVSRKKVELC